jgi:hypothetical protein
MRAAVFKSGKQVPALGQGTWHLGEGEHDRSLARRHPTGSRHLSRTSDARDNCPLGTTFRRVTLSVVISCH